MSGVIDALGQPYILLGSETRVGVSIGVAIAPQDGLDRQELMRKADIALYEAKTKGAASIACLRARWMNRCKRVNRSPPICASHSNSKRGWKYGINP